MSISSKPDHFFQTTTSIDEINRRAEKSYNTSGGPIKLASKILAVIPDPSSEDAVYVAESTGTVERIDLSSREVTHTFTGPPAPVSCICIHIEKTAEGIQQTLFGGCWDKNIWCWRIPSGPSSKAAIKSTRQFRGHIDFVKALVVLAVPGSPSALLISGGAESEILFWDIKTGDRLHVLKGHLRGILDLHFDPATIYPGSEAATLYSASSDREIRATSIPIKETSPSTLKTLELSKPLLVHETSVYALDFDPDGSGLWTASADKTAKHLTLRDPDGTDSKPQTPKDLPSEWEEDTTLDHPDFVRAVVTHQTLGWVITACRDEEVRIWNAGTGKLEHVCSGHYEEVTGLCVRGNKVVSVSIDGTVRSWPLGRQELEIAKQEAGGTQNEGDDSVKAEEAAGGNLLTEEEERELADLMADE